MEGGGRQHQESARPQFGRLPKVSKVFRGGSYISFLAPQGALVVVVFLDGSKRSIKTIQAV